MSFTKSYTGVSAEAAGLLDNVRAAHGGMAPWQRRKVERYLRDNLEHPLQVGELAKEISLSSSQFFGYSGKASGPRHTCTSCG
jgi:hypothetical protein